MGSVSKSLRADELFEQHREWALREACVVARRGDLSEEVQQAALLGLHKATLTFDELRGSFKPYASRFVAFAVKDEFRRLKRLKMLHSNRQVSMDVAQVVCPSAFVIKSEEKNDLDLEIRRLLLDFHPNYYEVLRLFFGLNCQALDSIEIARRLNVKVAQVTRLKFSALAHLRTKLK